MGVLYAARGGAVTTSDLYTVNPLTAATTSIGPTGFALTGLAFDPTDGTLYGVTSGGSSAHPKSLVTIDPLTGAGTFIGSMGRPVPDIAFNAAGQLFGWDINNHELASINKTTGALTDLGSSVFGGATAGNGIAITSGDVCYLFPKGSTTTYYTMNLSTGAGASAGGLDGSGSGTAIAAASFDGVDVCWAVNGDGGSVSQLDSIDVATGAKTTVGALSPGGGTWDALAWLNASGDTTPPTLLSIAVLGATVTLHYDEALQVSPGPSTSEYVVTVNGSAVTVSAANVSGSDVVLTISPPALTGFPVLVSYTA